MDLNDGVLAEMIDWMARTAIATISEGAQMLIGVGILAIAAFAAFVVVRPERSKLIRLGKGPNITSYLEPPSLARSIQRSLRRSVHPQITVEAKGRRLVATAPYRTTTDPREIVDEVAARVPTELEIRGVPKLRYRVGVGRPAKRRVR